MARHVVNIAVPVVIEIPDGVAIGRLPSMFYWIANDWRDGRFPFSRELIETGAAALVTGAITTAIEERFRLVCGNEMVADPEVPGVRTAKAIVEAAPIIETCHVVRVQNLSATLAPYKED